MNIESPPDPTRTPAFRKLCRLAGRAIADFRMIPAGSRLLVGLSGGKDSLTLAHVLTALRRRSPVPFDLEFAFFNPGFPGFGAEKLRAYAAEAGWPLRETGLDMPAILAEKKMAAPCVLCSRLRRGLLYRLAAERGCDRLALGQHLDDAIASFFMSLTRGQGLTTMGANVRAKAAPVRVIRPLIYAPEALIVEAAAAFHYPACGDCPYRGELAERGDRAYFRRLADDLTRRMPHFRRQMLHSLQRVETDYLLDPRFLSFDDDPPTEVPPCGPTNG